MRNILYAVALLSVPAFAQTYPVKTDSNTAVLDGAASDWEVLSNNGTESFIANKVTGYARTGKPYATFKSQYYRLEGKKYVPQFTITSGGFTQADVDAARARGKEEALAAAIAAIARLK